MRHIKTYESRLDDINNEQICKLAILRFASKLCFLYKEYYGIILQLKEEKSKFQYVRSYFWTYDNKPFGENELFSAVIEKIKNNYIISFHFHNHNLDNLEIVKFIDDKFNFHNRVHKIIDFTVDELNVYSDSIVEEFELSIATKKYNL